MEARYLELARLIAKAAHFNQFDKGGKPIFEHVCYVSGCMETLELAIVGMLHDVIEDSILTNTGSLAVIFGAEIAKAVDAISRRNGEKYFDYIERVKQNEMARLVKIQDLRHNMNKRRWPEMPDSYWKREAKALDILLKEYTPQEGEGSD